MPRMELIPQLVLRTLISFALFSLVANEICDDGGYTVLNNPRRSAQATYDAAVDTPLCDSGIDEGIWFRFSSYAGDTIVERAANDPVPMQHCGTVAPIYIRGLGSHPVTDNTTTDATVCANYGGTDTCNWMETIQIYRCPAQGDPSYFYLYKLKSPPGCSLSYCVGEETLCNRGEIWNGFFCVTYFPAMKGFPIFSGPLINGSGLSAEIYFSCEVQYDRQPNDINARFRVTFLFDGLPLEYIGLDAQHPPERLEPTILNPNKTLIAILDESKLRGRLGREISCQAEPMWDGFSDVSANASMRSVTTFYAAFESTASSYSISLTSGSTFDVAFQSTLPLTCSHCVTATINCSCTYAFRMINFTASSANCHLYWTGPQSVTAVITVYFVPVATQARNSFALVFEKYNEDEVTARGESLWRDYVIPAVSMTILPPPTAPYKSCIASGDPHLITFDKTKFDNLMIGDFYLARAINANQLMEIQVRHETCNYGKATCICGVVVREGNSAFWISICEAGSWSEYIQRGPRVVRLLSQNPADSSTVYMDATGLKFSVRMPSGLRVEVDLTVAWSSVDVRLPPEYHGKTDSGSMCGNSNGNSNDDSRNPPQFRIPDDLSYFRRQPTCSNIFNVAETRCGCDGTYPICSNKDPTLEIVNRGFGPYSGRSTTGVVCDRTNQRKRRDTMETLLSDNSNSDNDFIVDTSALFPPYSYDPTFGANVSFTWPTPSGKTQAEVEQHCADMLQSSSAYGDCSPNVDVATIVSMCTSDIQIADEWVSVSAYANVFQRSCLNNLAADIKNNSDPTIGALMTVSEKLCPNQCSGNGTCLNATCTCNTGYIGDDCSIDQSLPPSLTGIIRGGLCDVRIRPCDVISVYGRGVAISSSLKCRFTDPNTGSNVETEGKFISAGEYSCPVPETTTHRRRRSVTTRTTAVSSSKVSITIDGVLYSNALDFVLFDSVCMECNSSDTCRQKENSCLISDECSTDKAVNPDDSCLQCVPSVNRNSWTNITVVEDWSPCTRACDTGVATRNTICGTTVTNEEIEFCKVLDCPDNAEQEKQGFGITLSSEDLKLILREPTRYLVPFIDALNLYCSKNAAVCCNSIKMPTGASTVTYTSPDLLTYASGQPVISNTETSLKIIVKIDRSELAAECSQTQTQESNIVYADPKLIYDAVNSEKSEIEQALGITITSVWSPDPALKSTASVTCSSLFSIICIYFLLK